MNKKIILAGIVLIILASACVRHDNAPDVPVQQQKDPCSLLAEEYKSKCGQINTWLDLKTTEWKPAEYKPMNFGVFHVYASDNMFVKSNAEADFKMLDAIEGVDPDTVVLYIQPGAYFSHKERYDALISKIRSDGKKLFVGARFDDGDMDTGAYGEALEEYTRNIIANIKPDYYGIVIEPATMEQKHNFEATDEQWSAIVGKTAELSKQLAPATKTVAAGHKEELDLLRRVSEIENLDIVGFNIYGTEGIYEEYSGYLGKGDVVGGAIDFANSKGKETWILETWTSAIVNQKQKEISIQPFMKPIDAKWVRAITYYAQKHDMAAVVPFYTGKFVYYGDDAAGFVSALNGREKTPAFYEYKSVISEVRANAG